jgi:arsenite methyltransferase
MTTLMKKGNKMDAARRSILIEKYGIDQPPPADNAIVDAIIDGGHTLAKMFNWGPGIDLGPLFDPAQCPEMWAVAHAAMRDLRAAMANGQIDYGGGAEYQRNRGHECDLLTALQLPTEWLSIPPGGIALDVGCGPGSLTASLARAAGPDGVALGVDISEPMLARAVSAEAGPQIGFLRADAQRLPLREETVDAVVSVAVLQLIPDPVAALAEMARVLRLGGRLAVMAPTAGRAARLLRILPNTGVHLFGEDELGDILEDHGFIGVRTKSLGTIQWVRAKRG